ncbi:MAG TPA: MFS transporter [Polyangia bacterium]
MTPSPPDKPSGLSPSGAEVAPPSAAAAPPARRSRRALLWTFTTYFGEGLPWSFLHQMGTEYLTAIGASKTQIGSTSLLHLAVTFKFAWSPLVDLFGRLRTWVIVLQLVLGGGMFAVAAIAPSHDLKLFWVAVGLLSIVHATHDIACDGFYLAALDKVKQALFSGVRVAAFRVAMIAGNSGLVALAGLTDNNWALAFGAAAILMIATALLNALAMPRPAEAGPRSAPPPAALASNAAAGNAAPAGVEARGRRFWRPTRRSCCNRRRVWSCPSCSSTSWATS